MSPGWACCARVWPCLRAKLWHNKPSVAPSWERRQPPPLRRARLKALNLQNVHPSLRPRWRRQPLALRQQPKHPRHPSTPANSPASLLRPMPSPHAAHASQKATHPAPSRVSPASRLPNALCARAPSPMANSAKQANPHGLASLALRASSANLASWASQASSAKNRQPKPLANQAAKPVLASHTLALASTSLQAAKPL